MAGKKISQLTLLPTLDGTELLPLVKGGENYSGVTEAISKLLLSLDNKFTGDNSFVGGKFAVTGSESEVYVSAVGNLVSRSTYGTTGWLRSFEFSDNDVVTARFGVKAMTTDNVPTTDFVGILVGSGTVNDSQYKFRANRLTVPDNFSILTNSSYGIVNFNRVDFPSSMVFGSSEWNTVVRSNDTDLVHFRNGNNYNIWDASNLADPVTKSGDNAFTGMNSFVGGQFSVGGASGATEILVRLQLEGSTKGALGNSVTNGTFLYDYTTTSYLAIKADGAYYGKESSMEKIVTESTITTLTKQITNLEQRIATLEGAGS